MEKNEKLRKEQKEKDKVKKEKEKEKEEKEVVKEKEAKKEKKRVSLSDSVDEDDDELLQERVEPVGEVPVKKRRGEEGDKHRSPKQNGNEEKRKTSSDRKRYKSFIIQVV